MTKHSNVPNTAQLKWLLLPVFPTDCFNRMASVKSRSHESKKKLWKRKTAFSYSPLVAHSHFSMHKTGVWKDRWTIVFYPVMIIRVWFKTAELLSVLLAIKAWFDLDFQAVIAPSLCILLRIVPPLYRFFRLTLLILFEEAVWGQSMAWRNTRPEEQHL